MRKTTEKDYDDMDDNDYLVLREYQKYKEKFAHQHDRKFIEENKNFDAFRINQQMRRDDLAKIKRESTEACLERKRLYEEEKYKQSYFLVFRRGILKMMKDEKHRELEGLLLNRRRHLTWIKRVSQFMVLKEIYNTFMIRKRQVE
jgi:hypothetical protein